MRLRRAAAFRTGPRVYHLLKPRPLYGGQTGRRTVHVAFTQARDNAVEDAVGRVSGPRVLQPQVHAGSINASSSMIRCSPSPSQDGHIPAGSFGLYSGEKPADGLPKRENRIRSAPATSTAVATVDRALPENRRWSMTVAKVNPSMRSMSAGGCCGSRLRTKDGYPAAAARSASAAMVSKTNEDFPDPETPVTTVNRCFGILTSMFARLLVWAPVTVMSWICADFLMMSSLWPTVAVYCPQ